MRGFQSGRLELDVSGEPQPVDEGEAAGMEDTAASLAGTYAALRDDIANGTWTVPDFAHAVRLATLVEDIMLASESGAMRKAGDWPR